MSALPAFQSTGFQHLDARIERAIEQAYKLGFDAGIEHQKQASPPPKARELAKQLDAARDAASEALDAALQAFAQLQEQLIALTAERDALCATAPLTVSAGAVVDVGNLRPGDITFVAECSACQRGEPCAYADALRDEKVKP